MCLTRCILASIQKRENGKWRARYRDDAGKEHARHFERKIDAQRWLDSITASVVRGDYVDPKAGKVTIRGYYAEWSRRQLWESSTERTMLLAVTSCPFADLPLNGVRPSHFESWVKQMSARGLSPFTVHTRVNNVRSIFKGAIRDRLITQDPANGVVLPRRRRAEHRVSIPTPDQVRALYAASEPWYRIAIALGAFAGMRLGEINGMQLEDVDFLRRTIHVERQVQRPAGKPIEIRPPKYGSERIVPAPDDLLVILSEHVRTIGTYGDAKWLFPGRDNGPAWPRTLDYQWDVARSAAGLEGVRLHDLRHFYASGLIASGCDVVTVQRALGHKSPSVTLNTYSHLWPTAEDRTRAGAASLIAEAFGGTADSARTGQP